MRKPKEEVGMVTLAFHFASYEEAEAMLEKIDLGGGLSPDCEGHIYDEDDSPGYVLIDAMSLGVLSTEAYEYVEEALEALQAFADVPETWPVVYALLPLDQTSQGMECTLEEEDEVHVG